MITDLRFAVRQLLKAPGFSLTAIITLALGIGANTAIFSVIDAVLLRPLPYPEAQRIICLSETDAAQPAISVNWLDFLDWQKRNTVFAHLAVARRESFNLNGLSGRAAERVSGAVVTADFFSVIGLKPEIGRVFTSAEDQAGGSALAVISDRLWEKSFGRDPGVLGRAVSLHDRLYQVVGVMPPAMTSPSDVDVWVPMKRRAAGVWNDRSSHPGLYVWGRLRDNVDLAAARAQMQGIASALARQYPATNTGIGVALTPLLDFQVGDYRRNLILIMGAVGLVLLIACANLANLLAARGAARAREFAVRAALGASRARLVRQLLTESLLLAVAGGLAGFLLAFWARDAIVALSPAGLARLGNVRVNGAVLFFSLGLSVATSFLFGLWPARLVARIDPQVALRSGSRGSTDSIPARRVRGGLIIAEIALTLLLLSSAGLVLKSFARAQALSLGFEPRHLLTARIDLGFRVYDTPEKITRFCDAVLDRIRTVPGAESAAFSSNPPMLAGWQTNILREGAPEPLPGQEISADTEIVRGDYLAALHGTLRRGRFFDGRERKDSPPVVVIDQSLGDRYFPGENPIGKRLRIDPDDSGHNRLFEIIGVVARMQLRGFDQISSLPIVYFAQPQVERSNFVLLLRTNGKPAAFEKAVRDAVAAVDPTQPVYDVRAMDERVAQTLEASRFLSWLLNVFAGLALLLSSIGLYGVLSYNAQRQLRELGIRLALGAQRSNIRALILRQGVRLLAVGLGLGLLGALAAARLLRSYLFEVASLDPLVYLSASLLLVGAALAAIWGPARRAARVDPIITLRSE